MKHFCISKFKSEDHFNTTWNSFDDIGKTIEGSLLDKDQYLVTENAYVKTLIAFIKKIGISSFRLERFFDSRFDIKEKEQAADIREPYKKFCGGQLVDESEIELLIRLSLRNFVSIRLITDAGSYMCFGEDLYAYVGFSEEINLAILVESELFIEECEEDIFN